MSDEKEPKGFRTKMMSVLTKLAHGSAPFLSVFLLVHLSAPISANVGGSHAASNMMLLGREYYQTELGEKALWVAPLAIHVLSASVKRLIAPTRLRPLRSALTVSAWSALIFYPVHVALHRLIPEDVTMPIGAVGPSELDWEFVKTGLARFPIQNWALYAGLIASIATHWMEGVNILRATYMRGMQGLGPRGRKVAAAAVALPVLTGLWFVSKEPLLAFGSLMERYEAVFLKVPLFQVKL
ncbi:hypothetical protein CONPUDRAFT_118516 [Coniophora puteana RWD-64-598 SS2]|uniref:Mitochondrial adapter protein MCP1 transmembrane domain-containing protein n=1 Tax=Coniophora puteana (strain RWD-64-598) TaxID=741705 RepID=A0A5M3N2H9_CONPW|nr:uncharacterized protein CONPUDRAFT_118516 [Coniophora puteana RWD-64-598 SS2]EIW85589.1 hypothetical protein CONPUDRAFT_118516 [Coniophora puteana RWD-64-598 SS2]